MTSALTTEIQTELEAAAERCGCELVHLGYAGGTLRLVLDAPAGVTIEHCERVSREASALLDVLEFGSGRYTLEVSSPGLDRELYRQKDYERFQGERVKVTWLDQATGNRRTDVGRLAAFRAGDPAEIEIESATDRLVVRLPDVQQARLDPEF